MTFPPVGQRVHVVGTTGSGKTTVAAALSACLNLKHVELDAHHWQPNWSEPLLPAFRQKVKDALSGDSWVVDGNYGKVRDLIWPRADTIVWLDYPLLVILWQLTRRTFARIFFRQELWSGNRESLRTALFSRDSLFLWALKTYRRRRRDYPQLLALPEYAHLTAIQLASPRQAKRWLSSLPTSPADTP